MQLHDHAVVARHQSHLSQQLGAKKLGVALFCAPTQDAVQQGLRLDFRKIGCARGRMAVIARARPVGVGDGAARGDCCEVTAPLAGVLAG